MDMRQTRKFREFQQTPRDEYENPASARKRHEEKKRIAQEKHQQRLALKKERDRVWRESQRKADGQTDEDA